MATKTVTNKRLIQRVKQLEAQLRSTEVTLGMTGSKPVKPDVWNRTFGVMNKTRAQNILKMIERRRKAGLRKS